MNRLTKEATGYFDDFATAFSTFDGEVVARLFTHPYLAVDQHGSQSVFNSAKETARYFQVHLDNYKSSGSEISSWRESYCVLRSNGKMSTYTSIDHTA